jgi:hypothetical protein
MRKNVIGLIVLFGATALPNPGFAVKLDCPDTLTDDKTREVMATSAPEVKVRASAQGNYQKWQEVVRPLVRKAAKQAKEQRSKILSEGIENSCTAPLQYVGQIIPVPERASGCEHKIVTRPADDEHVWVQAVAICKYDWACCTMADGAGSIAGVTLEGPLGATSSTATLKK